MTPDQVHELTAARENLCHRRGALARDIAADPHASAETIEALTKVLTAIEAIDRALNEAGHPYMSDQMRGEASN